MTRSFSNANLLAAIADGVTLALTRRGYSTGTWSVGRGISKQVEDTKKKVTMSLIKDRGPDTSSSWVPDPVTGYYRPGNRVVEVDAADLRELLLNQKFKSHQQ
ncbi:late embryogenesis abundant protein Lea5-like [Magnolia sinica]|uniref:late embryogenesis abundant protein Lea5-like n=1 Tax=Magnolia sinica TaxID=86752 RepID=UPI00265A0FC8|nr:late embryogenesis abundant protein Lea5-like [Magnolia sinica]